MSTILIDRLCELVESYVDQHGAAYTDSNEPNLVFGTAYRYLATRYLSDRQAEAGARLGVLGTWLLPVLIRRVEEL